MCYVKHTFARLYFETAENIVLPWSGTKTFTRLIDRSSRVFIRSSPDLGVLARIGGMTFCNVLVQFRALSAENESKMLNRHVSQTGKLACGSVEDGVATEGTLFDSGMGSTASVRFISARRRLGCDASKEKVMKIGVGFQLSNFFPLKRNTDKNNAKDNSEVDESR